MRMYKENLKYNVVSMRVTDEEKAILNEMKMKSSKSISKLMREAVQLYTQLSLKSLNPKI